MKTVRELSRDELIELKGRYLTEHQPSVSYGDLANADTLVSDETIFAEYAGVHFVPDDFFCNTSK